MFTNHHRAFLDEHFLYVAPFSPIPNETQPMGSFNFKESKRNYIHFEVEPVMTRFLTHAHVVNCNTLMSNDKTLQSSACGKKFTKTALHTEQSTGSLVNSGRGDRTL